MADTPNPEEPSASERRLDEHLADLRADPPRAGRELVVRVARGARWQRALRTPLRVAAQIAGGVADGLRMLLGLGRGAR